MALSIKAEYVNGKLNPLEALDLEEGRVVTLTIEKHDTAEPEMPSDLALVKRLQESIPPEAYENMPSDGSINYRYHLYGSGSGER